MSCKCHEYLMVVKGVSHCAQLVVTRTITIQKKQTKKLGLLDNGQLIRHYGKRSELVILKWKLTV